MPPCDLCPWVCETVGPQPSGHNSPASLLLARSPPEHRGYYTWVFWADRLSSRKLSLPAYLKDSVFFVSLQQASHHAHRCGTLMRSWHGRTTKAQEHQPQAGSQTLLKIGSLETVLLEDVNHTISLYCGPAQLSSICSRIVQLCLWAKGFLVFISAASWAP